MPSTRATRPASGCCATWRANAMKGRPHGKNIYGYERVYDQVTRQLVEVVEHPEHGPVVREAAKRILAGETYYAVAKDFNARGIPPRRPSFTQRRRVLGWTPPAIRQMLSMPAYAGLRQHQGKVLQDVEAVGPPLLEPDEWHRLQGVMAGRSRQKTNSWPAKHLLGGIAECGICGAGMRIGKQNKGRPRLDRETGQKLPQEHYNTYVCQGAPGRTSFHVAIKEDHLDLLVTEVVLARLERPDFLARVGQQDDGVDAERAALLEEVRAEAERVRNLSALFDQERRVAPKIEAAQKPYSTLHAAR
jgi:site-specific DNA recombinase